jgi:hypothetical protein
VKQSAAVVDPVLQITRATPCDKRGGAVPTLSHLFGRLRAPVRRLEHEELAPRLGCCHPADGLQPHKRNAVRRHATIGVDEKQDFDISRVRR